MRAPLGPWGMDLKPTPSYPKVTNLILLILILVDLIDSILVDFILILFWFWE